MTIDFPTPWHKASYDHFLIQRLPQLLTGRIPDSTCTLLPEDEASWRIILEVKAETRTLSVEFLHIPAISPNGIFTLDGQPFIVVPIASQEELDQAEISCVGEMLDDLLSSRLGYPPSGIVWDENLIHAFLPLEQILTGFFQKNAQRLDNTNWHARQTHLRRIIIPNRKRVVAPGQIGRVDPFETPEGPNIGRVFTIALGAEIRGGKILILDASPEAALGPNSALIPFIAHDDANRILMGVNMMRQGLIPPEPEPALVQTGREPVPAGADLWCGRNLLTAFIAWGEGCVEDGLIISQSCADRLNYPYPAEPGDKLSNRHGTKGVVSQVLPDDQMPHLANGLAVEICYSFTGLHTRCQMSLVLEAVMGKIAQSEGQPVVIPAFRSPGPIEIQARLESAGFSQDGQEKLHIGKNGPVMDYPSTVGWVYWYRLVHLARQKLCSVGKTAHPDIPVQAIPSIGEQEFSVLRKVHAYHIALEAMNIRQVSTSPGSASPYFSRLAQHLAAAGISASLAEDHLLYRFQDPQGDRLHLSQPFAHPWMPGERIQTVGLPPAANEDGSSLQEKFLSLQEANTTLARRLENHVPERLRTDALTHVEAALSAYFQALLPPDLLRLSEPQRFSAKGVISPAVGIGLDQVGLPGEIFDILFAPSQDLDQPGLGQAENTWVLILRQPAISPTSFLSFHPIRVQGASIRLHPQACELLNTDFDGDQVSVFLPLSATAQEEAGRVLSVAGHITRDPALLSALISPHEGLWGAAYRSLTSVGKEEIAAIIECSPKQLSTPLTRAELNHAIQDLLTHRGVNHAITATEQLMRYGYAATTQSGASLHPFLQSQVPIPPAPAGDDAETWTAYREMAFELFFSGQDYHNPNMGPQLLSAAVPVRPKSRFWLPFLVIARGLATGADGKITTVQRSFVQGYTPAELFAVVAGARMGLARLTDEWERNLVAPPEDTPSGVLSRARRAQYPGVVFAAAASRSAAETLSDDETRILVGLAPIR
jgi:hypothetical protein